MGGAAGRPRTPGAGAGSCLVCFILNPQCSCQLVYIKTRICLYCNGHVDLGRSVPICGTAQWREHISSYLAWGDLLGLR